MVRDPPGQGVDGQPTEHVGDEVEACGLGVGETVESEAPVGALNQAI